MGLIGQTADDDDDGWNHGSQLTGTFFRILA